MSDLVYSNGLNFSAGTAVGFSFSSSFRLLDEEDKMPGNMGYSDAYPIGVSAIAEATEDYIDMSSGDTIFETFSDDPAFMAGAAFGIYLSEKYFGVANRIGYNSELEDLYDENDLDEVWSDFKH